MSNTGADDIDEDVVETEPYRTTFETAGEPASTAVVSAVAAVRGVDPLELPPLYDAIDPDALDALFKSTAAAPRRGDRTLEFAFDGHAVTVQRHGVIVVEPLGLDDR